MSDGYTVPGFVNFKEKDGVVVITSQLFGNQIRLTDPDIIEEFHLMIKEKGCLSLNSQLKIFLHDQDMLLSPREIAHHLQRLQNIIDTTLFITIMPTESCNFRCPYCYENHKTLFIKPEIMNIIQQYIVDQTPKYKKVIIAWFGGEPTLCKNIILETTTQIKNLQKTKSFEFTSSMTTNGYLLQLDDFIQYYNSGITEFQITLDGWTHDQTRPLSSGKGTLKHILDNLISISQLPKDTYKFRIILRHNILSNDTDYSWYDYLYSLFGNDSRFSHYIHSVDDWGGESVKSLDLIGDNSQSLIDQHVQYIRSLGMWCENEDNGIFSKICYASLPHSMVFRADGKISKCTVCLNEPQNYVGNVDEDKGVSFFKDKYGLWSQSRIQAECYQCKNLLSCMNKGCKKQVILQGGDAERYCDICLNSSSV